MNDDRWWSDLAEELDRWSGLERVATMWLRDDDAVRSTDALAQLMGLCDLHGVPLSLAVVPEPCEDSLRELITGLSGVEVLAHGWRHQNHEPHGFKRSEFGEHRPVSDAAHELGEGLRGLCEGFEKHFVPVLVPPWNRIAQRVVDELPVVGYRGLSTFGARETPRLANGLYRINCHVDLLDWRGTRGFRGLAEVSADMVSHLRARRTGSADASEPTGVLTHHLVHDRACWSYLENLFRRLAGHPAHRWVCVSSMVDAR